ncbi:MAG: pyruvate kinase [Proteobacteria bacterium]|nr:pyruvate kinase [Pseudomonadota bacterium]
MTRQRIRKTKLVATIGPACDSPEAIKAMIRAGMNVARLNFSHGTHEEHRKRLERIREAVLELGANVATMLDTKGVKIRTGRVEGGVVLLETGADFSLYTDGRVGDARGVAISYPQLANELEPGTSVLLDDGVIELVVNAIEEGGVRCRIRRGGRLRDRRGVNVPGTSLGIPSMNSENRADLLFAIENDITYIAASFVRHTGDIREIRQLLQEHGSQIPIVAKIESAEGVANLDDIVAEADCIMVARGDLGVEMPVQELPILQKKIIRATVMNGKAVITATQMLDSMQRQPTPTRAEVTDVANAILDGTSAVMLSNETADGAYPVEAVRTMAALALQAEEALEEYGHLQHILPGPANVVTEAVSQAAITMANHLQAAAIMALTESGFTARSISKYRPSCPILGVTTWQAVQRRMALNWGVTGILCPGEQSSNEDRIRAGVKRAKELGYVERGDIVVVTAGAHGESGSTNLIRVIEVD